MGKKGIKKTEKKTYKQSGAHLRRGPKKKPKGRYDKLKTIYL